MIYQDLCEICGEINEITNPQCDNCGKMNDRPVNVRRVSMEKERNTLFFNFENTKAQLETIGLGKEVEYVKNYVSNKGMAILNTNLDFIWKWLLTNSAEYVGYRRQIIDNLRLKAVFKNDVDRTTADSILYGSENDFVYGALTTNETGLSNYGKVSVLLKTSFISERTSLMIENSFDYIYKQTKNKWAFGDPLPTGAMSSWDDKGLLATVKVSSSIKPSISDLEIDDLILQSGTDRSKDQFIEIHINGKIVKSNVEKLIFDKKHTTTFNRWQKLRYAELSRLLNVENR